MKQNLLLKALILNILLRFLTDKFSSQITLCVFTSNAKKESHHPHMFVCTFSLSNVSPDNFSITTHTEQSCSFFQLCSISPYGYNVIYVTPH